MLVVVGGAFLSLTLTISAGGAPGRAALANDHGLCPVGLAAIRAPATCAALFGDDEDREANRRNRERLLVEVEPEPLGFAIVHRTDWREPVAKSFRDLAILETATGSTCDAVAIVALAAGVGSCEPGTYA